MPSAACTVKDGGGSPQTTTSAYATATAGNTVTIAVADTTGVGTWSITCIGTDETLVPATVTSGLTVNSTNKTATFTAPAAGKAMIFQSVINGGRDSNGDVDDSYTTTFKVAVPTAGGHIVCATNEELEHSAAYGWTPIVNDIIRDASDYLNGTITATTVYWYPGGVTTYPVISTLQTLTTTNATPSTLITYAHPASTLVRYTATITGRRPSNGDSFCQEYAVTYNRVGSAAPTIVGSATVPTADKDAGASTWAAVIEPSSNNMIVKVTGQSSATINWSCELRAQERS